MTFSIKHISLYLFLSFFLFSTPLACMDEKESEKGTLIPKKTSGKIRIPIAPDTSDTQPSKTCSSTGVTAYTAILATYTILAGYQLFILYGSYNDQYSRDFPAALNTARSEGFPKSLAIPLNRTHGKAYFNKDGLFNCYEECRDWTRSRQASYFPENLCSHPNQTSPEYIDFMNYMMGAIQHLCGQSMRDLWSPWLDQNFANLTTLMYDNYYKYGDDFGLIQKIQNQSLFLRQNWFEILGSDNLKGYICSGDFSLFSYDPVCIAKRMCGTFFTAEFYGWSLPAVVLWGVYFYMYFGGWF